MSSDVPSPLVKCARELLLFAIIGSPVLLLALQIGSLPDEVPMHYNLKGEVDRVGSKSELWIALGAILLPGYGISLLLGWLTSRQPGPPSAGTLFKMRLALCSLLAALGLLIVLSSMRPSIDVGRWIWSAIALIFPALGAAMGDLKPNALIGVRTTATLSDERVWHATHRYTRTLWIGGGLLTALVLPFLSYPWRPLLFFLALTTLSFLPVWRARKLAAFYKRGS